MLDTVKNSSDSFCTPIGMNVPSRGNTRFCPPPDHSGHPGFLLILLQWLPWSIVWTCRNVPDPLRRIKRTHVQEQRPHYGLPPMFSTVTLCVLTRRCSPGF